ncbi:hypothetical protein DRB87_20170 [Pandoraea sp. XY-2]|nr:hypothetical protein DRB87_20170 [Pandoraea sp. XY-2]
MLANGKRQTANGKRQTANGKRQTANGKRQTAAAVASSPAPIKKGHPKVPFRQSLSDRSSQLRTCDGYQP